MNSQFRAVFLFVALFAIACATIDDAPDKAPSSTGSIVIHNGFTLGDLLKDPRTLNSPEAIESVIAEKWTTPIRLNIDGRDPKSVMIDCCDHYLSQHSLPECPDRESGRIAFKEAAAMCLAAEQIVSANGATESHLAPLDFDEQFMALMPEDLALTVPKLERRSFRNDRVERTWGEVSPVDSVEQISKGHARYRFRDAEQELQLVAQGDFNDDGIEDIIISSRDSANDGSYSAFRLFVLTRFARDARFTLLEEFRL